MHCLPAATLQPRINDVVHDVQLVVAAGRLKRQEPEHILGYFFVVFMEATLTESLQRQIRHLLKLTEARA